MFVRLAPIIFVCLWATGFVGAKFSMPFAEPASFLFLRYVFAFALLAVISVLAKAKWPNRREAIHAMIVGALIHGLYLWGVFWAVRNGLPGGVAAIITGLQPLLTALIAGWWLREEISIRHWLGLAVGLVGIVLVVAPKLDDASSGINSITIVAALLAVLSIALGTTYQKRFATQIDLRTGTAMQYIGAMIPIGLIAATFESFDITWNAQSIFAMVWLVVVLSIFSAFLLMWLIREGSVAKVSSLFYLVPAVAAGMTWFLFGEELNLVQMLGMVLCAAAVALATIKFRKNKTISK